MNSRIVRHRSVSYIAALLGTIAATAGHADDRVGAAVEAAFSAMRTGQQPGCAVGVSQPGRGDLMTSYGYANLGTAEAIGPDTSFNIGSASKQFTGFAVTLLEQDGKLRVSDPIRKYLPELPAFTQAITIDHLLHHTGGVPNLELLIRLKGLVGNGTVPPATRIALLSSLQNWNQPPGMDYEYSNTGYFLLAQIVARVSGMSFAEFLQERAFKPAGMTRTIVLDAVRTGAGNAESYLPDGEGGFTPGTSMQPGDGPSGVQSSLRDMLAWARYVRNLKPATMARLSAAGALDTGERLAYGRGLRLDHFDGLATIGHQGAWSSYRAEYRLFPDRKAAIVILCNRADASPWEPADKIAGAMFPGATGATDDAAQLELTAGRPTDAPTPGLYRNALTGAYMTVERSSDGLFRVDGERRFPMTTESPGIFRTRIDGMFAYTVRYAFVPGTGGVPDRVAARSFGEPSVFERVDPWRPADLDRYAGDYASTSLGLQLTLSVRDGLLTAEVSGRSITLQPLAAGEFGSPDVGIFLNIGIDKQVTRLDLALPNLRHQIFYKR